MEVSDLELFLIIIVSAIMGAIITLVVGAF